MLHYLLLVLLSIEWWARRVRGSNTWRTNGGWSSAALLQFQPPTHTRAAAAADEPGSHSAELLSAFQRHARSQAAEAIA